MLDFSPEADKGWDMMRSIKGNPLTQNVPVLFYSPKDERGIFIELELITKPTNKSHLAEAVERVSKKITLGESKIKILLVDDEPLILDLHERMLMESFQECIIYKATNGRDALNIMKQYIPDVVLLDLMMPDMNGFEVLTHMREMETTRLIPVIVVSAQILDDDDFDKLQKGVASVIKKGLFSSDEIMNQVEKAIQREHLHSSDSQLIARRTLSYLHHHFSDSVCLKDISSHLSVSERHITRCFHNEMGITPLVYLKRYRIQQAKNQLEEGVTSITRIAHDVGFSDSNYFSRIFRQEVGVPPSKYLREQKEN